MSSTFLKQTISDSEDDEDYVPPAAQAESDSDESDSGTNAKTTVTAADAPAVPDEAERKRARDALWSSFQESVKNPTRTADQQTAKQPKMIKIERRYLFAGEEVREVVEVAEDSSDAKKWPLWKDPNEALLETAEMSSSSPKETTDPTTSESQTKDDHTPAQSSSVDIAQPSTTTTTSSDPKPPPTKKKPGPRKSKVILAPLPGSTKAKKLTTLDKSAMDWNAHLQAETASGSAVTDQLVANRKGGGYLEKVEFLKRVDERKDETLESLKSTKRRRL